jgi:hypothetical protein
LPEIGIGRSAIIDFSLINLYYLSSDLQKIQIVKKTPNSPGANHIVSKQSENNYGLIPKWKIVPIQYHQNEVGIAIFFKKTNMNPTAS